MLFAGAAPALAICPAANLYTHSFAAEAAATLNYGNTYNYTATNGLAQTQAYTVSFFTNGLSSSIIAGNQMPAISTLINDGAGNSLVVGGILSARTPNIAANTGVMVTTLTFVTPIRDLTVTIHDIDFTFNQFRDWFMVVGRNGAATYVPAMTTPFGQVNNTGPFTNGASSLSLGPVAAPIPVTAPQALGNAASGNNANTGNVTMSFLQPVTSVELRYGNYPLQAGEAVTGQQGFGIDGVSFCPMPTLTVAKTSAPYVTLITDPNRFNIPLADVIYSLTITNANTSPVDLSTTVLTDALPANVRFYNGDIDDGGPLTTNFEFVPGTSGLTFAAGNLTYSNNGGATYAYGPAAGYDAAVNALRFAPTGSMAANSSFTIRFRARIN